MYIHNFSFVYGSGSIYLFIYFIYNLFIVNKNIYIVKYQ